MSSFLKLIVYACAWMLFASSLVQGQAVVEDKPGVSATDLLLAEFFPDAGFAMSVERTQDEQPKATVITTGAEFVIDKAASMIECRQRIAAQRPVALIKFPDGALADLKLAHESSGSAIFNGARMVVRVNCDSLLMISPRATDGATVTAELSFTPDFHNEFRGNYNFFDPLGGISFFEHGRHPEARFIAIQDPVTVTYPLKTGEALWAAVSPPKPYNWEASVKERVVMLGSSVERFMYPSDTSIARWSRQRFTHLLLCSELQWEHWQLSLVPRHPDEYRRVINTAHEFGMKVFPYISPKMFIKGTPVESRAAHDPAAPTAATTTGWHTGSNVKLYLEQATRIVEEYGTDGLYFDEMYTGPQSLAAQYFLARSARQLVADGGPLMYHCTTDALGDGHTRPVCPPINAWFSFILKGENEWSRLEPGYTRYVLSTYNTSNSIGMQLVDERFVPDAQRIDLWLRRVNVRFAIPELFIDTGQIEVFRQNYWPRLEADRLKREVEGDLLKPTGIFPQFRQAIDDSIDGE